MIINDTMFEQKDEYLCGFGREMHVHEQDGKVSCGTGRPDGREVVIAAVFLFRQSVVVEAIFDRIYHSSEPKVGQDRRLETSKGVCMTLPR